MQSRCPGSSHAATNNLNNGITVACTDTLARQVATSKNFLCPRYIGTGPMLWPINNQLSLSKQATLTSLQTTMLCHAILQQIILAIIQLPQSKHAATDMLHLSVSYDPCWCVSTGTTCHHAASTATSAARDHMLAAAPGPRCCSVGLGGAAAGAPAALAARHLGHELLDGLNQLLPEGAGQRRAAGWQQVEGRLSDGPKHMTDLVTIQVRRFRHIRYAHLLCTARCTTCNKRQQ